MLQTNFSTFYPSTRYGVAGKDEGPLIVTQISSVEAPSLYAMQHKAVVFVVDISASMSEVLPMVKSSILAFRKVLFPDASSATASTLWRSNIHIITFSDEAEILWSADTADKTFEEAILSMDVQNSTNMGAGIELAFSLVNPEKATWIVILTDGISNKGRYQTAEAFVSLAQTAPKSSKTISIGYGSEFDPHILNAIGDFQHVETPEDIPKLMGALAHEVSTATLFNAFISGAACFGNVGYIDSETNSVVRPLPKIVIGDRHVGVLSTGRKFIFGFVPGEQSSWLYGARISLHGLSVTDTGLIYSTSNLPMFNDSIKIAPDNIRQAFYQAEASRMITGFYQNRTANPKPVVEATRAALEMWLADPVAIEHRETVLRIANDILRPAVGLRRAVHVASSASKQTSYVIDAYATPGGSRAGRTASEIVSGGESQENKTGSGNLGPRKMAKVDAIAVAAAKRNLF